MAINLSILWTQGLTEAEAKDLKQNLLASQKELEYVRHLVYNLYLATLSTKPEDYDSPGWAFKRARLEGKQAAFEQLLQLLDLTGEDRSLKKTKKKALTDDRTT